MVAEIETRLRKVICPLCVRRTQDGGCSLPPDRPCSLFENLDEVVRIVADTKSPRIDPYVDVLRKRVCDACHFQDDHGRCPCREDVDCALNTYYPLIVEVIEDVLSMQKDRSDGPGRGV